MATANLMIAAQSLDLGTYLRTGGIMRDPDVESLVGLADGFRIVGIVALGRPLEPETPRKRRPAMEFTRWITS
jgi:nitroreductase